MKKRVALMALINLVPILSWVNTGYAMNWAKGVVDGGGDELPKSIVNGENFKTGFFVFVVSLLVSLAVGFEGAILGLVPILGILAAIALGLFADMFACLSYMQVARTGKIGAAFEVSKLFEGFKRNLGTLFCVSIVPNLVMVGLSLLVGLVLSVLIGAIAGVDIMSVALSSTRSSRYSAAVPTNLLYAFSGSIGLILLLSLVAGYIEAAIVQFCVLVKQRAVAYYIQRNVPEWRGEGADRTPAAAAGDSAGGAAGDAGGDDMYQEEYEVADYEETWVLPEYDEDDAETTVQPELKVDVDYGAVAARSKHGRVPQDEKGADAARTAAEPAVAVGPVAAAAVASRVKPTAPEKQAAPVVAEAQAQQTSASTAQSEAAPDPESEPQPEPVRKSAPATKLHRESEYAPLEQASQSAANPAIPASAPARAVTLQLTRANGDVCKLTSFPVVIGSGYQAELVIDDNSAISRAHAQLLRDGDVFAVEDLGSTNKTYIGDYELPPYTPTIVSDGDSLRLADETLRVNVVDW